MNTGTSSTGVQFACRCGFSWNDGDFGFRVFFAEDANVTMENNKTNCPKCGQMASSEDGTYQVRKGNWRLVRDIANDLKSAEATYDDFARLASLLQEAQAAGTEGNKVADDIAAKTPFARVAEILREHPPGWAAWLITVILAIALWLVTPPGHSDSATTSPGHDGSGGTSLEHMSSHDLDEIAKKVAKQLQAQKIEIPEESASKVKLKGSERNQPCPCKSGLKHKKCCRARAAVRHHQP